MTWMVLCFHSKPLTSLQESYQVRYRDMLLFLMVSMVWFMELSITELQYLQSNQIFIISQMKVKLTFQLLNFTSLWLSPIKQLIQAIKTLVCKRLLFNSNLAIYLMGTLTLERTILSLWIILKALSMNLWNSMDMHAWTIKASFILQQMTIYSRIFLSLTQLDNILWSIGWKLRMGSVKVRRVIWWA